MKKSFTILFVFLFTFLGIKTIQAQTQEETSAWIIEKLEKYGGTENIVYREVQINSCVISYYEIWSTGDVFLVSIPGTSSSWMAGEYTVYNAYGSKIIKQVDVETKKEFESDRFLLKNEEPDIHINMVKALSNLASHCRK